MSLDDLDVDFENVRVKVDSPVTNAVTIVFDRPDARNAMNQPLRKETKTALEAIEESDARAIVLTGSDEAQTFVSGADVEEFNERTVREQRAITKLPRIYEAVENHPLPTVARINGHALGGGCELALACDVRVADSSALLGFPEITLGLIPGGGGTQRLPRLVGHGKAMQLILTGDLIRADEAADVGMVEVVTKDLDEAVEELVGSISSNSPVALEYAKQAIQASRTMGLNEGIEHEFELFLGAFASDDASEGIEAFVEDREPTWQGQ